MSSMAIEPISNETRRARRSLLTMSLLLICMKYAGLTVEKITIFGSEMTLTNPEAIFVLAWLIWGYLVLSFLQYFFQQDKSKLRYALNHSLTFACGYKMAKIITEDSGVPIQNPIEYAHLRKTGTCRRLFKDKVRRGSPPEEKEIEFEFDLRNFKWELVKAAGDFIVKKSATFEYILPFAVILFTLVYCNLGVWRGTLINIINSD